MRAFDVVIVGGGPGGAAAALQCREANLGVAIIERDPGPRDHSGETLPPGIEPLLRHLGITDLDWPRFEGYWLKDGASERFEAFGADADGPWQGFHACRRDFDARLLQAAAAAGTVVIRGVRALRPLLDAAAGAVGVLTDDGPVAARWIIDASGPHHWLARALSLPFLRASPQLIATYGYAAGRLADASPSFERHAGGWTWTAQVQPNVVHWTTMTWSPDARPARWPPPHVSHLPPIGRPRRADGSWRAVREPAGPGYFIVGDAATVVDPASSHGVLHALMSGMMAGYLIARYQAHGVPARALRSCYTRWVLDHFRRDTHRLRDLYSQGPAEPDWCLTESSARS